MRSHHGGDDGEDDDYDDGVGPGRWSLSRINVLESLR